LILRGSLRDYSDIGERPYINHNFLFLGDDTTSASANIELAQVAVLSYAVPEPSSIALASISGLMALAPARCGRRVRKAG
jgi:hypothetical protein